MSSWWDSVRDRLPREQAILAGLFVAYLATGFLGLRLAYVHPAVTLIWPPAGIALGAVLVLGYRVWPGVLVASVIVYSVVIGGQPAVLAIAAGNTLESVLGAYLINRFGGGRHALQSPRDSFRFAGLTALAATTVSATVGTISLILTGLAPLSQYLPIWLNWAAGHFAGTLLVGPFVMLWIQGPRSRFTPREAIEATAVFLAVILIGLVVFCGIPSAARGYPLELLCIPVLLWAAFRLGRRASSTAILILTTLAVVGTLNGNGPFFRTTPIDSLAMVMAFMCLTAVMTLTLAALASEYAVTEAQLRELVVTDPVTGLPNHRRLLDVMSAEIARSNRSDRGFAVVFFDIDGLKRINDDLGHLMGSRALCRFAETIRAVCRATDTPARYGGDEFVAVLPDTDEEGARLVIRRVHERLAEDTDKPQLATSAGLAMYPRDGGTPTTLLAAADRALYAVKAEKANARRRGVVPIRDWSSVGTKAN
jgi:diguanylate cyclase (GGDEF)-like protein